MLTEVGGEERRQLVVCGTKGTIEILPLEPAQVRLCLKEPAGGYRAGWQKVELPLPAGRYDDMMKDFAGMVAGGASTVSAFTPEHDLLVLEILLAVSASPAATRARARP
jgi:predicted dehydrogenase